MQPMSKTITKPGITFQRTVLFAYFLFSDGNYEEAEEYAKKALEIKNNFVESITLLYLIYTIEGRSKEAETFERKAVSNGRSKKELEEILEYYIGESKR